MPKAIATAALATQLDTQNAQVTMKPVSGPNACSI